MKECTTRSQIIRKIADKTSHPIQEIMTKLIKQTEDFFKVFKSITIDNDYEFSELASIEEIVETKFYYIHLYSSWELDTKEHHNGLIRRFISKG
jgi:IS30 family transposase